MGREKMIIATKMTHDFHFIPFHWAHTGLMSINIQNVVWRPRDTRIGSKDDRRNLEISTAGVCLCYEGERKKEKNPEHSLWEKKEASKRCEWSLLIISVWRAYRGGGSQAFHVWPVGLSFKWRHRQIVCAAILVGHTRTYVYARNALLAPFHLVELSQSPVG